MDHDPALRNAVPARPWLAEYPPGVPADIALDDHTTLVDVLEGAYRRFATRQAAACMGSSLTFADIDRQIGRAHV